MKIDTEGVYTLQYTAEDECGNETVEERNVLVQAPPRTVLYNDGTLIINELAEDIDANTRLHGSVIATYAPFNPNGNTDAEKYIFASGSDRPWHSRTSSITRIEIGSNIAPTNTAFWFRSARCRTADLSLLDTSNVTDMQYMFDGCFYLGSLDLSNFNTENVLNMAGMFSSNRALTSIDISSFDTSKVQQMNSMFDSCYALQTVDVSSFDTSAVTNMMRMFYKCSVLTTIYASPRFTVAGVSASTLMFNQATALVGGAGTPYNSSHDNKQYARIDNPPDAPGYFTLKSA